MAILAVALLGCVLGVVFVKFRKHIPGHSTIRKSVVFALILVVISLVPRLFGILDPSAVVMFGTKIHPPQLEYNALTSIEYLLFGWLFGYLLQRRLKSQGI